MNLPDQSTRVILSGDSEKDVPRLGWRKLMLIALGVAIVGGASSAVWVAYNQGMVAGTETAAPLIRSKMEETRRRPAEPGGMQVPNRDKLVFDRIAPDAGEIRLERLLPPPEAPLPKLSRANEITSETNIQPLKSQTSVGAEPGKVEVTQDLPEKSLATETPPPTASPPAAEVPDQPISPPTVEVPDQPVVAPVAELAAIEPAVKPTAEPLVKGWRVQVASMRSVAKAEQAWKILTAKYDDLLGELYLNVEEVTLGARGTFYRVQAGPLSGKTEADALCAALKTREQGCLVVRP